MYQYEERKKDKTRKKGGRKEEAERAGVPAPVKYAKLETGQTLRQRQIIQRVIPDDAKPYVDADELYDKLTREYVLAEDVVHFGKVTKSENAAVSVRDTGNRSLNMLRRGAGAKGHEILEKTIKGKSLGCKEDELKTRLEEQGLSENISGLVARWEKGTSEITGLYLTPEGERVFRTLKKFEVETGNVLSLKSDTEKQDFKKFIEDGENAGWEKYFYTGDYDLHDMVSFTSQTHSIPSESQEEKGLMAKLNEAMTGKRPAEWQHIRHGPSVNYIAHNLDREPGERIVEVVARMAPPVAMCDRGKWSVLEDKRAIAAWYERNGVKMKETWDGSPQGEERIRGYLGNQHELCAAINAVNDMQYTGKKVTVSRGKNPFLPFDSEQGIEGKLAGLQEDVRKRYIGEVCDSYREFLILKLAKFRDSDSLIANLKDVGGIKGHGKELLSGSGTLQERLKQLTWLQLHKLYLYQKRTGE